MRIPLHPCMCGRPMQILQTPSHGPTFEAPGPLTASAP